MNQENPGQEILYSVHEHDVHCFAVCLDLSTEQVMWHKPISPWFVSEKEARDFLTKVRPQQPDCFVIHNNWHCDNGEQRKTMFKCIFGRDDIVETGDGCLDGLKKTT